MVHFSCSRDWAGLSGLGGQAKARTQSRICISAVWTVPPNPSANDTSSRNPEKGGNKATAPSSTKDQKQLWIRMDSCTSCTRQMGAGIISTALQISVFVKEAILSMSGIGINQTAVYSDRIRRG